jgi:hypothetical protein
MTIDISLRLAISRAIVVPGVLPADMRFVRILHELELDPSLPHTTPPDRPEVRQLYPENLFVPFGKAWQMKAWDMNPLLTANNMTQVYDDHLWIANNNGFSNEADLRANWFTLEDTSSAVLKVEALTCGGNVHRVLGETTITRGGVPIPSYILETLDYRNAPPAVIPPWLQVWAVNMGSDGTPRRFEQGSQPNGFIPGVRHPFVSDPSKIITIPKWRCTPWTDGEPPDPYRVYLPT